MLRMKQAAHSHSMAFLKFELDYHPTECFEPLLPDYVPVSIFEQNMNPVLLIQASGQKLFRLFQE